MKLKFRNKKSFFIIATSVIVLIIIGTGYSLIVHNKNIEVQSESDTSTATVASLIAKLNKLNTEGFSEDEQSEYDAIKERFEKAIADGNVSLAKQELENLKGLCNSNSQTDTLVSEVVDSNLESENATEDEHDHENVHPDEVNVSGEQSTGVTSNTSSSSSTNNSSSTSKPSNGNSSNSSTSNTKPTKPSGGSSSSNSNAKPTHTHSWVEVYKDVYHEEEGHYENVCVKEAWTESIPIYEQRARDICNGCGKDITDNPTAHMREQMLQGNLACGGYHTEYKQVQTGSNTVTHDAIYEKRWVVVKPAWTEKVVSGYKCNCGATK